MLSSGLPTRLREPGAGTCPARHVKNMPKACRADGLGRGAGSWQCWHDHVEMNGPGSCQLLLAAFGAAPHSPMPVFGHRSVLPGWHAQHTPCAHRLPCAPPFSIPCQSLNLNEASRMAALHQCLDKNRAGIASGRAQGLSLPISHGEVGRPSSGEILGAILKQGLGVLAAWAQGR